MYWYHNKHSVRRDLLLLSSKKQEMMFLSTADKKGECDSSVRFGEAGFVSIIDEHHIIYPEFKGNGVRC